MRDTLVSTGPIDQAVLQVSDIAVTQSVPRPTVHRLCLVRILYNHQNRQEDLIYPVIQCDSWVVSKACGSRAYGNFADEARDY